jgi:hypothetical protein
MGMGNDDLVRADVNALIESIRAYEPDAVVDFWNMGACMAARACHKRLITVIQADMHPESRGFIWWKKPSAAIPTPVAAINRILAEFQLQPILKTGELFIGDTTLLLGIPDTDPLPDKAAGSYVGAILWQKPNEGLPGWFAGLNTMKPVIWLYLGNPRYVRGTRTYADSDVVTRGLIEALIHKDVQVILFTGHHPLPNGVRTLSPNFQHVPFVPGLTMAERCNLMIQHSRYGSCQTGLVIGTPALIVPTFSERESNDRRVAAAGAGD